MSVNLDKRREAKTESDRGDPRKSVTLFTLNEKKYKVPAKPATILALRYLDDLNRHGEDIAVARMLPALLGQEAWEALLAEDELELEEFQLIVKAATSLLMGGVSEEAMRDFTSE
jgi:hypothetical protein